MNTARWRVMQAMIAMLAVMACATPPPSSAQQSPSLLSPLPSTGSDIRGIVESGGVSRSFLLHLPPTGTRLRPMPLVIAFHGAPMTGDQLSSITHLSDVANTHGFAVLFPNGYMQSWAVPGSETPAQKAGIDDVAFVRSLDSLSPQYGFDSSRVIATGISNGGIFAQVLGCLLADHLAGIVPVAGLMRSTVAARCAPSRPVSVLEIHGTNDPVAPYQGGRDFLSLAQTLAFWVRADKCHGTAATTTLPDTAHDETTVTTSSLTGCMSGSEVTSYIVKGGGQAWPNGTPIGSIDDMGITTRQFDASELIWTFMQRHL